MDVPLQLIEVKERTALSDFESVETEGNNHKAKKTRRKHFHSNYTMVFKRSGYSYSKRLQSLVVKNNAMRDQCVEMCPKNKQKRIYAKRSSSIPKELFSSSSLSPIKEKSKCNNFNSPSQKYMENKNLLYYDISKKCEVEAPKNTNIIARILHPNIPEDYLKKDCLLVILFKM